MKKCITVFICFVLALGMIDLSPQIVSAESSYFIGDGTADNPYQIASKEDLFLLSQLINGQETSSDYNSCHYIQTCDIDLENESFTPIGTYLETGGANSGFAACYDGNYHCIKNLNITDSYKGYIGIFGWIYGENASVSNLIAEGNIDCPGYNHVGGIAGELGCGAKVENCAFKGSITGNEQTGGIAGSIWRNSTVISCYFNGEIESSSEATNDYTVGGIVGLAYAGYQDTVQHVSIKNCYATGTISGKSSDLYGGILGQAVCNNTDSTISLENNYYLATMCVRTVSGCINLTENALKACADMLGEPFIDNTAANLNDGYPVFEWQIDPDCFEGLGTQKNPYKITSAEDLWNMAKLINSPYFGNRYRSVSYIQTNNINLKNELWTPIGANGYKGSFLGTYDGNQYFIQGLKISEANNYSGLFDTISNEATIKNLVVYGDVSSTENYTGGICGEIGYGASIVNCAYIGNVKGVLNTGGICGKLWDSGAIFNCYSYGEISGKTNTGGITGMIDCTNSNGTGLLKNCYHVGAVTDEDNNAGGIVGYSVYNTSEGNVITLKNSYYLKTSASIGFNGDAVIEDCTGVPENVLKKLADDLGAPYTNNTDIGFIEGYPCFDWQITDITALKKYILGISTSEPESSADISVLDLRLLKQGRVIS